MTDADVIRREREAQDLSRNELTRRAGLSAAQVSRYERGGRAMTLAQARKIAKALGVSLAIFDAVQQPDE